MRTPIFPVKKIRDEGQLGEWRFLQDLQSVNDAVQQCAPNVPNPYTILSQVPPGLHFLSMAKTAHSHDFVKGFVNHLPSTALR